MTTEAEVDEHLRWGLAAVHAAAMGNEEAAGTLVGAKLNDIQKPTELLLLLFGLIEAGAIYVHAASDASGVPVQELIQQIGLISME